MGLKYSNYEYKVGCLRFNYFNLIIHILFNNNENLFCFKTYLVLSNKITILY